MKKVIYLASVMFFLFSPGIITAEVEIGAYMGTSPPTKEAINDFEAMIGRDLSSVLWYEGWNPIYRPTFNSSFLALLLYTMRERSRYSELPGTLVSR